MQNQITATTLTTTATATTPATRTATPGQAVHLGNPLAPTVALPPDLAQQNQQFAAQFPRVVSTVQAGSPSATPPLVAVTIASVTDRPGLSPEVIVHVHVPPSMAPDGESCKKLSQAVCHYLKRTCYGHVGYPENGPKGEITVNISGAYNHNKRDADRAIAEINSAVSLVHYLGLDSKCLIDLVNDVNLEKNWLRKFCHLFFGDEGSPTFQLYKHVERISVVMLRNDDHFIRDSIDPCASWLSKLGLKTLARELLAEAIQGMDASDAGYNTGYIIPGLCTPYLTLLFEGDLLADKTEATKAVDLLASRLDDANVKWESSGGAFKICGSLVTRLCSDEACHPELAWKLLQHIYAPPGLFDNVEDEGCAKALTALFSVAMQKEQYEIAEGAINALRVMKGPSADKAFEVCRAQLQASETIQALGDDNPHRQTLRAGGFEFRFGTSPDVGKAQSLFVLHPTAMVKEDAVETAVKTGAPPIALKTGEPPTKFVAKKHGQALLDFTLSIAVPAIRDNFAASCFVAVAEFLFQHYSALPQAVQVRVLGGLTDTVVKVISSQCQSARKSAPASTPAIVACLPMFVEAQILKFMSFRLQELLAAGDEDGVSNFLRWIGQHKQQLFGHLPASMLPAGLQGLLGAEPTSSVVVDEGQARAEMEPLSSRLFALIAELFDSGSLSHSDEVADALFGYWTTFTGSKDRLGYHTARVEYDANRRSLGSSKEWSVTKKVAEDAQQALVGSSDTGSQVALDLYESLIDLAAGAVQVHKEGDRAAEVSAWAIQFLEQLGGNQQLLGSMSQVNPNAAIWPQLACAQLLLRKENGFAAAHTILEACASKPGVTWDSHFAAAFEAAIKHCMSSKLHTEAVQLFMLRTNCIDGSDSARQLQPLDKQTLMALISIVRDSLIHGTDPGVSTETALCALLVQLLALMPKVPQTQLVEAVLPAQVRSNHPTLAARVYLEFARHYFTQGDKQAMLKAFSTAMANAPDDEPARAEVQQLCREFLKVVESSKEGDEEWPDTIQALMSYDKV